MATTFAPLPVQLVLASVCAAVPDQQGLVTHIFSVGALGYPLESSCPFLALLPVVSSSLRSSEPAGYTSARLTSNKVHQSIYEWIIATMQSLDFTVVSGVHTDKGTNRSTLRQPKRRLDSLREQED